MIKKWAVLLFVLLVCVNIVSAAAADCVQSIVSKAYDSYNKLPEADKQSITAADYSNLVLQKSGYDPVIYYSKQKSDVNVYVDGAQYTKADSDISQSLNLQKTLLSSGVPLTSLVPKSISSNTGKGIIEFAPVEDVILKVTVSSDGISGIDNKALQDSYLTSTVVGKAVQSAVQDANKAGYDVKNGAQVLITRTPDGEVKALFNSANLGASLDNVPADAKAGQTKGTLSSADIASIPADIASATSMTSRLQDAFANPTFEGNVVVKSNAQKLLSIEGVPDDSLNHIVSSLQTVSIIQNKGGDVVVQDAKKQATSSIYNALPYDITEQSRTEIADALVNGKEMPEIQYSLKHQILAYLGHIL